MAEEYQARLFPKEAADSIGIAPATLRKYSQIVEEETNNSDFFDRTEQNIRTYSDNNIKLMKEISTQSQDTKQPVKNIVKQLLSEDNDFLKKEDLVKQVSKKSEANNSELQELITLVNNQNARIDQLVSAINILAGEFKEVKPIIEHQSQLSIDSQDKTVDKKQEAINDTPTDKTNSESATQATPDDANSKSVEQPNAEKTVQKTEVKSANTETKPEEPKTAQKKPVQPEKKKGFFGRLFGK